MKKVIFALICAVALSSNVFADGGKKPKEKKKTTGITVEGYATGKGDRDQNGAIHITCKSKTGTCISQVQRGDVFVNGKNGNLIAQYRASDEIIVHQRANPSEEDTTEIILISNEEIIDLIH